MFADMGAVRMAMGRVKSRFLRAVVETVQREASGTALNRLRAGLPAYLLRLLSRDVLGPLERDASVDVDAGIELLLAVDRVLCGGSGVVTSRATASLASRVLSSSPGLVVPGDTVATLQHLRAPFEQPFIDVSLDFSLRSSPDGFVLEVHVGGRPQAARWLCSAGLGYARAAATFSGNGAARMRLYDELAGDVARVMGRHTATGVYNIPRGTAPAQPDRTRPLRRRSSATNLAAQVDEILNRVSASSPPPSRAEPQKAAASPRPPASPGSAGLPESRPKSGVRPAVNVAAPRARKSAS